MFGTSPARLGCEHHREGQAGSPRPASAAFRAPGGERRAGGGADLSPISVIIPTRNRAASVAKTIESILANQYPEFEIIVVDQSDGALTRKTVEGYRGRVRYVRSAGRGVASARNEGVAHAGAEYIGFVDDDCEVAGNWLLRLNEAISRDSRIGAVFGNVVAGPHDGSLGFIPAYVRETDCTARSIRDKNRVEGLSACMATTSAAWRAIRGFDAMLGAGAELRSGAESDYSIRVLLAGYQVYETPRFCVTHHGFRDWGQGELLLRRYWFGTGAVFAKHAKHAQWRVIELLPALAMRWLRGGRSRPARSFGKRALRRWQIVEFARGFLAGAMTPTDRSTNLFRASRGRSGPESGRTKDRVPATNPSPSEG